MAKLLRFSDVENAIEEGDFGQKIPGELLLNGGNRLLVHQEHCYESVYKNGESFEYLENPFCEYIKFKFDFQIHCQALEGLTTGNKQASSNPMCCYHNHVWWHFAYRISVVEDDDVNNPLCQLAFVNIGPSCFEKEVQKGALGSNVPKLQKKPNIHLVYMHFITVAGEEVCVSLRKRGDIFVSDENFELRKLLEFKGERNTLPLRCELQLERFYFEALDLLPESGFETPVKLETELLRSILKLEHVEGSDAAISCGAGDNSTYHVHQKALFTASSLLQTLYATNCSMTGGEVLKVSHEDRFIFLKLDEDDMPPLLHFIYGQPFVLPRFDRFARIGRFIGNVFGRDAVELFLTEWQRLIVEDMLEAEHTLAGTELAMHALRHLISIYSTPLGAMPVAKRVCLSVFANVIQQHETLSKRDELDDRLAEEMKEYPTFVEKIGVSLHRFKMFVSAVSKQSV